jgi:transketolase
MAEIAESFSWLEEASENGEADGPYVIIYNTVKGKGVKHMEDDHKWHGAPIGDEDYAKARPELEAGLKELEEKL